MFAKLKEKGSLFCIENIVNERERDRADYLMKLKEDHLCGKPRKRNTKTGSEGEVEGGNISREPITSLEGHGSQNIRQGGPAYVAIRKRADTVTCLFGKWTISEASSIPFLP